MPKHIIPPQKTLFQQGKDTKISEFLLAVPYLIFSEKGLFNIARRFQIPPEELQQKIANLQKGGLK